jgi:hypothetical protein
MKHTLYACIVVAGLAMGQEADALMISLEYHPLSGATLVNFDSLPLGDAGGTIGGMTVSFATDGQAVFGDVPGEHWSPRLGGNTGAGFGSPDQPDGYDQTVYLSSGSIGGAAILTFSEVQTYFGLLWGSPDTYNTLSLYMDDTLVDTVTGFDVRDEDTTKLKRYVNIITDSGFNRVEATSLSYAFEFDNVAYGKVPDGGGTAALLGLALGAMAWIRRKII